MFLSLISHMLAVKKIRTGFKETQDVHLPYHSMHKVCRCNIFLTEPNTHRRRYDKVVKHFIR